MITRQILGFYIVTLYMILKIFQKKVRIFDQKILKSPLWICENTGIHTSYEFSDFPWKMANLGLKMKILKFLGIQPTYES